MKTNKNRKNKNRNKNNHRYNHSYFRQTAYNQLISQPRFCLDLSFRTNVRLSQNSLLSTHWKRRSQFNAISFTAFASNISHCILLLTTTYYHLVLLPSVCGNTGGLQHDTFSCPFTDASTKSHARKPHSSLQLHRKR